MTAASIHRQRWGTMEQDAAGVERDGE